jgi:hypothetical protein
MKKLLIVLSALVLAVAFAVPASAMMYDSEGITSKMVDEESPAAVWHGEVTFGWITPFASEDANIGFDNSYIDVSLWPYQYNVVTFRLAGDLFGVSPLAGGLWFADYLYLTSDLGAWFDLPVGLKNTLGITSLYSRKYEVTGSALERDLIRSDIDPLSWKIEVDAGMALITAGIGLGENDAPAGDSTYADIGVVVEVPEAGPVDLEVFYLAENDPDLKGRLGGDVKLVDMIPMVDLAAGFMFDTTDAAGTEDLVGEDYIEEWAYGIGAAITYSMATIGVAIDGNDRDALNRLDVDGKVELMEVMDGGIGVQGAFRLSFADDIAATPIVDESETFQGAEIGVYVEVNTATWKAGYVISDQLYKYASAVDGPDGGLFLTVDIDL